MLIKDKKPISGTEIVKQDIVFNPPGVRKFSKNPRIVGIHWTGGEGSPETLKKVLKDRNCSIHFNVAANSDIWQFCDLSNRCVHIGSPWNDFSIGIEVTCRGYASPEDLEKARVKDKDIRDREKIDWQISRDFYSDVIAGDNVRMASFSKGQIDSILWLCDKLSVTLGISKIIPFKEISDPSLFKSPVKNPSSLVVKKDGKYFVPNFDRNIDIADDFSGFIGHFHVHDTKHDPGTQPLIALWAAGWNPTGKPLKVEF